MANKKEAPIIIKKKKGGGGHGHHGGAWKVAYADFVTAMMCFFLVMWLMGSDDETKAAVAHYFNHPNTPWKQGRDPQSEVVNPLGEKQGHGDTLIPGANGHWPHDLIERPRSENDIMKEMRTLSRLIEDLLEGKVQGLDPTPNGLRFSLTDKILFHPGTDEFIAESLPELDTLGQLLKNFSGYVSIEGHTDDTPVKAGARFRSNWELSFARATAIMNYFIVKHGHKEDKFIPIGAGSRRPAVASSSPEARAKNRRVEFKLTYENILTD